MQYYLGVHTSKFLSPPFLFKVVKNLLFVAKVLYLLAPEPDKDNDMNEEVHCEAESQDAFVGDDDNEASAMEEREDEVAEEKSRPATLLWVMKRLSVMAKREAAYSPKDPLKVCVFIIQGTIILVPLQVSSNFTFLQYL